jgi:hypothetical protein
MIVPPKSVLPYESLPPLYATALLSPTATRTIVFALRHVKLEVWVHPWSWALYGHGAPNRINGMEATQHPTPTTHHPKESLDPFGPSSMHAWMIHFLTSCNDYQSVQQLHLYHRRIQRTLGGAESSTWRGYPSFLDSNASASPWP